MSQAHSASAGFPIECSKAGAAGPAIRGESFETPSARGPQDEAENAESEGSSRDRRSSAEPDEVIGELATRSVWSKSRRRPLEAYSVLGQACAARAAPARRATRRHKSWLRLFQRISHDGRWPSIELSTETTITLGTVAAVGDFQPADTSMRWRANAGLVLADNVAAHAARQRSSVR